MATVEARLRWHGVDRSLLVWHPALESDRCTGCEICVLTCGNDVFRWSRRAKRPVVANPGKCMVGCTTCARVCPSDALTFPSDPRVFVHDVVIKYKLLPTAKRELEGRLQKFPDHVVRSAGAAPPTVEVR